MKSEEPNHAAMGSFALLGKESLLPQRLFCEQVCPAALAIFMHDKHVWADMSKKGLLPFDITHFPLTFLLIYCDGLQEWGRPGGTADPEGQKSALINLEFADLSVTPVIWFAENASAAMTQLLHKTILKDVMTATCLRFGCKVIID